MSYLRSRHVVQCLPCPVGSVVLHLLGLFKERKEKNCERARKQIGNVVTNAELDLQFQTIKM